MPIDPRHEQLEQWLDQLTEELDLGKLEEAKQLLERFTPSEIAELIEALEPKYRAALWRLLRREVAGEVLVELHEEVRASLVETLGVTDEQELIEAVGTLPIEELADVIEELPEKIRAEVRRRLTDRERAQLDQILAYPEESAAALMRTDLLTVGPEMTIEEVLAEIRRRGELPEMSDALYVVDRNRRLVGILPIATLLTVDPKVRVEAVMERDFIVVPAVTPASDVAFLFEHHDLIAAPVVDEEGRLIGRITVDDVVEVIRDEAEHTLMSQAGLSEEVDMFAPVTVSVRRRAVWLGVNLVTAFIAAYVIGLFQETIDEIVALAVLMPIVASMGGIAGTQTQTLVIRALALRQIGVSNAPALLLKELAVGFLNGLIWAAVVGLIAALWFGLNIGGVIALAMVINLCCAAISGVVIPILLDKMGIDPALAGGVLLTTVTDVVGFFAFLGLATWLLL